MSTLQSFLANRHTENTQKLFSQIVNKPQHCPHCLLPTAGEPSVTDRLRSANKLPRIFVKTNGFKNAFISHSLNSLQCEWCFSYSSDCVMQPSSCHITINWLIDWLIDWVSGKTTLVILAVTAVSFVRFRKSYAQLLVLSRNCAVGRSPYFPAFSQHQKSVIRSTIRRYRQRAPAAIDSPLLNTGVCLKLAVLEASRCRPGEPVGNCVSSGRQIWRTAVATERNQPSMLNVVAYICTTAYSLASWMTRNVVLVAQSRPFI